MTETVVRLRDFNNPLIDQPWVLVLGGVTRPGNRAARRSVNDAVEAQLNVLWFDGFEEFYEADKNRIPLGIEASAEVVTVVGYADAERDLVLNRMSAPVETSSGSVGLTQGRLDALVRSGRAAMNGTLRRVAVLVRGYAGWRLLRPHLERLREFPPPKYVVYCDEHATSSAWHVARFWPDVPVRIS